MPIPRSSKIFLTNNLFVFLISPVYVAFFSSNSLCFDHRDDYITIITETDYIELLLLKYFWESLIYH